MKNPEYNLVERKILEQLDNLGYKIIDQTKDEFNDPRETTNQTILEKHLKKAIKRINPWIDHNNLNKAINEIKNPHASDAMQANKKIHKKLISYISLEQNIGKGKKKQTIKIIDFENPKNNEYLAINQVRFSGNKETIKPDITLFVNGIPLGIIECKSPFLTDPGKDALDQLYRYQNLRGIRDEGCEKLFWYNQFTIAAWKDAAILGTYKTPKKQYKEWKEPKKSQRTNQEKLISILSPKKFLDMIRHFTVYRVKTEGTVKMIARYQQYRAVQKALNKINKRNEDNQGGVIWHTQGSGKSLTMFFLGLKLKELKENPGLLIVTDRKSLDLQIKNTFEQCGFKNPKRAKDIKDLKQKLKNSKGKTVTTLIQKFQPDEDINFPVCSKEKEIFVMVDEAHRTQYKFLARNMRRALPNAYYIGFTGTPIEKRKRNTKATFGKYIDTYTIDESIEDNNTLKIHYQGRLAKLHLENREIDEIFDRTFKNKSEKEKNKLKKKYANKKTLSESPNRIKKICLNLLKHHDKKLKNTPFKAMIVTRSKKAAVQYKKTLKKLNGPKCTVIISLGHNDKFKDLVPNESEQNQLKEQFKDPNSDLKVVIVCDMLLTGFDVPIAQVMYVDKPLKEHTLLQAIARVNRPYKNKTHGLIIDYWGISDYLDDALSKFTKKDVQNTLIPLTKEKEELKAAHRQAISFFDNINNTEDCVESLENESRRIKFNRTFKHFSKMMDIVMPDPIADPYINDLKVLGKIYAKTKYRYRDQSMELDDEGEKVKGLIQESITSDKIEILNQEPVSIFDKKEFDSELNRLDSEKAKISELKNAIMYTLSIKHKKDPVYYTSLREKLEKLIHDYEEGRLNESQTLEKYLELKEELRNKNSMLKKEGFNEESELATYHLLQNIKNRYGLVSKSSDPEYNKDTSLKNDVKELIKKIDEIIEKTHEWKKKPKIDRKIRRAIKKKLMSNPRIKKDNLDKIANDFKKLIHANY